MQNAVRFASVLAVTCFVVLPGALVAQDEAPPPVRLHGFVELSPPEGAADQDASGIAFLHQRGERQAIHVHVRGLEPGATYEVVLVRGDESGALGTLTTRTESFTPRCYRSSLGAPTPPEDPNGGGDEGDGGAAERGAENNAPDGRHDRRRGDGDSGDDDDGANNAGGDDRPATRGAAVFFLSRDLTGLHYQVFVRGVEGDVAALRLVLSETEAIDLDASDLRGSVDVTPEQVAVLAAGGARLEVSAGDPAVVVLEGAVEPCLSESARDRIARRRAGTGALRVDTGRGDVIPLVMDTLADLTGATIEVRDAAAAVVLAGTVGELRSGGRRGGDGDPAQPAGIAAPAGDDSGEEFEVAEPHDASFLRGDVNDDGERDISDAIAVLWQLFLAGPAPYCADSADVDDSGRVEVSDAVLLLRALFEQRDALAAPSVRPGSFDLTPDDLFCGDAEL
jgi:hypothetical protein